MVVVAVALVVAVAVVVRVATVRIRWRCDLPIPPHHCLLHAQSGARPAGASVVRRTGLNTKSVDLGGIGAGADKATAAATAKVLAQVKAFEQMSQGCLYGPAGRAGMGPG